MCRFDGVGRVLGFVGFRLFSWLYECHDEWDGRWRVGEFVKRAPSADGYFSLRL